MDINEDERSILASRQKYDVFISYRGEDTRKGFTSHLKKELTRAGIQTFNDDDKSHRGEQISEALKDAINNSKFAIVIFSKNYATSSWCLDELLHILECRKDKKQIVLPLFYDVDPSDVRGQKRSYATAFGNHEERNKGKWKAALTTTANLAGWHSLKFKDDADLVTEIVNHIRGLLNSTSSNKLKRLVGIDKSVEDLDVLLSNAPIVGIWGMGGLGKTTLAEVMFEKIRHQFDGHCFLRNVREERQKHGSDLVIKFFERLSGEKDIKVEHLGSIKDRLYRKKLLIVLDDVDDDLDDYDSLLEDRHDWLNSESKVIITSRNQQVLRNIIGDKDENMIYPLEILNKNEALELFHFHALKGKSVEESYIEISRKFVEYANGLPLALKVLGSHLFGKNREAWESYLKKLEHIEPDQKVQKVLKISFDGLEECQKSIFLDIACFYEGRDADDVKEHLEACYCSSDDAIEVLHDKCLITLSRRPYWEICVKKHIVFEMHDLLIEMGQSIVRGSPGNRLENYSRLWRDEDIFRALGNNIASTTLEGVYFHDWVLEGKWRKVIKIDPSTFEKLPNLRMIHLWNISRNRFEFTHDFDGTFPSDLRYLLWDHYPLESLGSNFKPHNLGTLIMNDSKLKKLWNETQDVNNLKYVDLSCSKELTCLPDLSTSNLQRLCLSYCTSLVDLPPLKFQDFRDNVEKDSRVMQRYYSLMPHLINHKEDDDKYHKQLLAEGWIMWFPSCLLDLDSCSNLKNLSEISGNIKFICLSRTAIKELDFSIGFLNKLLVLDLSYCKCIKNLPTSIRNLESLAYLDMFKCKSIEKFPELPKSIRGLDLSGTSIQQVDSSSFECLPSLCILYMRKCAVLENLPTTICKLKSLAILDLGYCPQLKIFPEFLEPMENLEYLYLQKSGIEVLPPSIERLVKLKMLDLHGCENLKSISTNIYNMCNISQIYYSRKAYCGISSLILSRAGIRAEFEKFECRNSCSITNINVLLGLHDSYGIFRFTCCECFLFSLLHNILANNYFMDHIFTDDFYPYSYLDDEDFGIHEVGFSYSGNAIPEWCTHQSMTSSIEVHLGYEDYCTHQSMPSSIEVNLGYRDFKDYSKDFDSGEWRAHRFDSSLSSSDKYFGFLGFAICIVVDFDECTSNHDVDLYCEYHFKRIDGSQSSKFDSTLSSRKVTHNNSDGDSNVENNDISDRSSSYVFIWYIYDYNYEGELSGRADKAFFDFYFGDPSDSINTGKGIKQCGVRLIYRQDAKEFDKANPLVN